MLAALCRLLCQFTSLWIELSCPHETCPLDHVEPGKIVGLQIYIQPESEAFPASVLFWPWKTAVKPLSQGWVHKCLREEVSKRALKDCILSQSYFVWFWCNCSAFNPSEKGAKTTVTSTGNQSCWNKATEQMHYISLLRSGVYRRAWENTWAVVKVEIILKLQLELELQLWIRVVPILRAIIATFWRPPHPLFLSSSILLPQFWQMEPSTVFTVQTEDPSSPPEHSAALPGLLDTDCPFVTNFAKQFAPLAPP